MNLGLFFVVEQSLQKKYFSYLVHIIRLLSTATSPCKAAPSLRPLPQPSSLLLELHHCVKKRRRPPDAHLGVLLLQNPRPFPPNADWLIYAAYAPYFPKDSNSPGDLIVCYAVC